MFRLDLLAVAKLAMANEGLELVLEVPEVIAVVGLLWDASTIASVHAVSVLAVNQSFFSAINTRLGCTDYAQDEIEVAEVASAVICHWH